MAKSMHSASLQIVPSYDEWSLHVPGLAETLSSSIKEKAPQYKKDMDLLK